MKLWLTISNNLRAAYRFAAMILMTVRIYSIGLIGAALTADNLRGRQMMFFKWSAGAVKIAKMKIEIRGTPPPPPFFLVSNHLSYMDIAAFGAVAKCFFVAKSEVANWFFVGRIVKIMGTVFVDRRNRRDILLAGRKIAEKIENGESLIMFPEGTSSGGEKVLPFKSSFLEFAAQTKLPVSYAAISYQTADGELKPSESVCWWGDAEFLPHIWRLFQLKTFTAIINFGDEAINNPNRKELAELLQKKVSEKFEPVR